MERDDLFRRSFEAATTYLGLSRERAEAVVKELVKAGEVSRTQAQRVIEELVDRSRQGTEEARELIRREIAQQLTALGVATKDDISRLEAKLDQLLVKPAPAPARRSTKKGSKSGGLRAAATSKRVAKTTDKSAEKAPPADEAGPRPTTPPPAPVGDPDIPPPPAEPEAKAAGKTPTKRAPRGRAAFPS